MPNRSSNTDSAGRTRTWPSARGKACAGGGFTRLAGLLLASMLMPAARALATTFTTDSRSVPTIARRRPVAQNWIDANDVRVRTQCDDLSRWWTVFQDPTLDTLICFAYRQNLSLRVAAYRVLEARAQMLIDMGNLFPQTQTATGSYTRNVLSRGRQPAAARGETRWYGQWNYGFNLSWELDFWGRLRRAIESDSATVDASVDNYDDVLVTLLGDVATNYVAYRTAEQRIKYAKENVALQRKTLQIVEGQLQVGIVGELDVDQARSTLEQTEAGIPELEIARARPRINCASCWAFRPKTCKPGSVRGRFPRRRRKWPSASPPTCSAAGPTSAAPSGRRPPRARKSALPRPSSIRTSPSSARSASPPRTSRISSRNRPSRATSARRSRGTSSTMAAS